MSCVMCHVSHLTCHVLCVRCEVSCVIFFSLLELVGEGSVINGATPPLVFKVCIFWDFGFYPLFFWYWCYYLHTSRDSVSPICGIFLNHSFILFGCFDLWCGWWLQRRLSCPRHILTAAHCVEKGQRLWVHIGDHDKIIDTEGRSKRSVTLNT